jgi:hypothetical protein
VIVGTSLGFIELVTDSDFIPQLLLALLQAITGGKGRGTTQGHHYDAKSDISRHCQHSVFEFSVIQAFAQY